MKVTFKDKKVAELFERDESKPKLPLEVIQSARTKYQAFRKAENFQIIREWNGLHCKKLKGSNTGLYSVRLNDQWRLLFRIVTIDSSVSIEIDSIVDYH